MTLAMASRDDAPTMRPVDRLAPRYPLGYIGEDASSDAADRKDRTMCSPIRCSTCGKVTWTGCGQHVDEALAPFSADERCTCAN